jgi:putative ABC transport system substrate-binding protein
MQRRRFIEVIAGGLLAAPLAAEAQQTGKVWRIGLLETTAPSTATPVLEAFRQGLRELGYIEGKNIAFEYRWTPGRDEQFRVLAAELVRLKVDVIVTRGTPAALAAKNATKAIPIVMAASGNPVETGVVASLARPGR